MHFVFSFRVRENVRALRPAADENVRTAAARQQIGRRAGAAPKLRAAVARVDKVVARRTLNQLKARKPASVDCARIRRRVCFDVGVARAVREVNNFIRRVFNDQIARRRTQNQIAVDESAARRIGAQRDFLARLIVADSLIAAAVDVTA